MKKLNLGCGEFKKEGFINVDARFDVGAEVVHDLEKFPYPFKDSEFDHIEADHVLEHLSEPFSVMKEIHRLSKNGGAIIVRVPHFSRGFTHPEHKRGFDVSFPLYFSSSFAGGYQGVELKLSSIKLTWLAQKYLKEKTLSPFTYYVGIILDAPLSFLANLSPFFCSRLWCFWVGGFEEIEFYFRVVK
ncbi:MAG: methyltransferase domain-containing protein [bacterium]|nr:methyltransferase domain-containing protein [bacterium]